MSKRSGKMVALAKSQNKPVINSSVIGNKNVSPEPEKQDNMLKEGFETTPHGKLIVHTSTP